jgi:SPP1 gp7 family putative phage head morphogenesis protein
MPTILDALTRQQLLVEGAKLGALNKYAAYIPQLKEAIGAVFNALSVDNLGNLSKKLLLQLQAKLRAAIRAVLGKWIDGLDTDLQALVDVERKITLAIAKLFDEDDDIEEAKKKKRGFPLFGYDVAKDPDALWKVVQAETMAANGLSTTVAMNFLVTQLVEGAVSRVSQGYANSETTAVVKSAIVGSDETYSRDGLLARFFRTVATQISTLVQHVTALAQNAVMSIFVKQYQWVSVLDNKTSDICRQRDGKVFEYENGPLPPAHPNCRSRTIPYGAQVPRFNIPDTFTEWLRGQPDAVKEEFAGSTKGGRYMATKPLTPSQVLARLQLVLAD